MAITFSSNIDTFTLLDVEKIKKWLAAIIQEQGKRVGTIGYLFCDDEYLLDANQRYLNHDTYTDIITFDYVEGDLVSGDIMISIDRVGENAEKFGCSFTDEIHRVIAHGVLHLLGQGDKTELEAAEMRKKEEQALVKWQEIK